MYLHIRAYRHACMALSSYRVVLYSSHLHVCSMTWHLHSMHGQPEAAYLLSVFIAKY